MKIGSDQEINRQGILHDVERVLSVLSPMFTNNVAIYLALLDTAKPTFF
ncbi:hypothetical protein [Albibacterium indicum]|nr:hypothetical protein [Pedobacter indicus]